MKKTILSGLMCLLMPTAVSAFEPVSPGNLNADVNGMVVDLSWEWGNAGEAVLTSDFEWDDLNHDRWEVKNTYNYDMYGNWMLLTIEEAGIQLSHEGKCAAVMIGMDSEDDPAENHQDEWLIVRPGVGAVYMDFWYFIHPELLEVGAYRDFPDHYYVKISYDNGESWEELWDARWDMGNSEGVQQASLFLGDETDENTLVAFNAVSGEEETLYFLWTVDDVEFYSEAEYAERTLSLKAPKKEKTFQAPDGVALRREFTPANYMNRAPIVSPDDWLNGGNITYRVYLDDEIIADYLKARYITDYTSKEPGEHTYKVMAWSEALDEEYDAASISVQINEVIFAAPTNVVASYEEQSDGKYIIQVSWEEPESDVMPSYYNVMVNGKSIGWAGVDDDYTMGQSGIYKGAYTFGVEAVYEFPDGVSELICDDVYPGTVPTVRNLKLEEDSAGVNLSWEAPATDALQMVTYSVFRGDELLAEGLDGLSYTDANPINGQYFYNVHAVYGDEISLPQSVAYGEEVIFTLPFEETFDNGHLPTGWNVELIDPYERVKEMYHWRFDNWFDIIFPEDSGMEGGCASVSGIASGLNLLQTFLVSPEFEVPEEGEMELSFVKYYSDNKPGMSGAAQMLLAVCVDGSEDWRDLVNLQEVENGEIKVSLADYKGHNVRFRWGFNGRSSGEVGIDNVKVSDGSGVEAIIISDGVFNIYTVDGMLIMKGASKSDLKSLPKALYILKGIDGNTVKYLAR
ncbi:MAG: hypothetical protein HDR88_08040 [Bacteroides sp.]|nr:hypothetical protein [Bacteroides sp.]